MSIASERLRVLREENNYTQRELAELLSCTQVSYLYYEKGRRAVPAEVLLTLSELYDVSVDYLLGATDIRKRYPVKTVSAGEKKL